MKNARPFGIAALVVLALVAEGLWLWNVHQTLLNVEIEKAKGAIASDVLAKALPAISPDVVANSTSDASKAAFDSLYRSLQSPRLIRLKIWTPDSVVIWSNLIEIIGQRFPDNQEVKEAAAGDTVMTIESPSDSESEHVSERNFQSLTETYVPLKDVAGKTYGIVELYGPTSVVEEPANMAFMAYATPAASATLVGLAAAIYFAARKKRKPASANTTRRV